MKQVKIFYDGFDQELEHKINDWVADMDYRVIVNEILFTSSTIGLGQVVVIAMVVYTPRNITPTTK